MAQCFDRAEITRKIVAAAQRHKEEDAGGLTPGKDDDDVMRMRQ